MKLLIREEDTVKARRSRKCRFFIRVQSSGRPSGEESKNVSLVWVGVPPYFPFSGVFSSSVK
jgi:hypothetical protein